MSGFTNVTGFAPPVSGAGFMGLLQAASFRGVPFKVVAAHVRKGRRQAVHEYPFRDGGWPEDMGRALRTYSFRGYLIGDIAAVMQLLLDQAVETKGPGLLVHPTIGAVLVDCAACSTAVHREAMRVIEVELEFIEHSEVVFPTAIIATAISVLSAATSALSSCNDDLGGTAGPAAEIGPEATDIGQQVVTEFAASVDSLGGDPSGIVGLATALPPPDANTTYGRYADGAADLLLPVGSTVATLQAQLATQRALVAQATAAAVATVAAYTAATDMLAALSAIVEAMRAGISDPADQVRVLLALAGFPFALPAPATGGVGAARAAMGNAMAAACRQAAVISLARAAAAYRPFSYDDAATLRVALAAALNIEVTAAGDAGQDASYGALKALRSAVVRDLTVRGASLPTMVSVTLPLNMPSLAIAQRLYKNASRADQLAASAKAIHPAFCPRTFQALAA